MINSLLIFIGCGIGGLLRYWVANGAYYWTMGRTFPYGTLIVNTTGSFLMGFLFIIILERFSNIAPQLRAFLLIGLLGGYTTFSSFSIETINLFEQGELFKALLNIGLSVVLCIGAAWAGVISGKNL